MADLMITHGRSRAGKQGQSGLTGSVAEPSTYKISGEHWLHLRSVWVDTVQYITRAVSLEPKDYL